MSLIHKKVRVPAIANCQHSYSYVLPFVMSFLEISNNYVNQSISCANHFIEDTIGEQQTFTIVSYETSISWAVDEACSHDWAMNSAKSFVEVTWAMIAIEVTVVETTFDVVLVAAPITTMNSLSSGCACATNQHCN